MLSGLVGHDAARMWHGYRSPVGPLKQYYRLDYPTLDTPFEEVEFVALDIECTGLDIKKDEILSVGLVPIVGGSIKLCQAEYYLIKPSKPVPKETAVIHGILDGHLEEAPPLDEVIPKVLESLAGRIPVAHHCLIEDTFLSRACKALYGQPLAVPYADTMTLEMRRFRRRHGDAVEAGTYRLGAIRERYKLPRYRAQNALIDAIACGEVFLAQVAGMSGKKSAQLRDLLH